MSRCFPFPPPGYEKKVRTDDVDLLKKEKHKEKKHKKEKREKEKKENKEKREKDKSDGKPREKKDKKEKQREKKKDKEKDRGKDRDKNSTADEKRIQAPTEVPSADKLIQKEYKHTDRNCTSFEEKCTRQYTGYNGEKLRENTHAAKEFKDSKFVEELGRRIKDVESGAGNQLVQKYPITDRKIDEGTVRLVAKGTGTWPEGKEKFKDKIADNRKFDGQGILFEARPSGNDMVRNHTSNLQPRVEGMPRLLEKNFERVVEGKEKIKEKKGDDKRRDKSKDKDKKKKGHGKDKDRDKEKKNEEKVKEKTEHKNTENDRLKESIKVAPIGTKTSPQLPKDSIKNAVSPENLKKRKDIESNGVLHANDNWPSKLPRPSSFPHPFIENGRILEPCQTSTPAPCALDRQGAVTVLKVENKGCKINGIIEARPSSVPSRKTTVATAPADQASVKPPHPDSKYLSQVYSVPKLEGWSDFDDQEWLFGSSSSQIRKAQMESSEVREVPQVWAEALQIEPADICALPYVIPY
ncbi:myb-like protein X isoform X2 [Quillaja saponaria]|uniref:Myb-like protein X isoform X2 n=1 Tax=Quillaja saponaria TaxID=32244 RepID=A0AAD7LFW9_QUISA|nr:myb-like protein X isoform X2 [Quillaja saponaria]